MVDIREIELAKKLVNYSCKVGKGDKVWIEYSDCSMGFVQEIVKQVLTNGGYPYLKHNERGVKATYLKYGNKNYFEFLAKHDRATMQDCDCAILIGGEANSFEFANVSSENMDIYEQHYVKPVHLEVRVKKRWVLLRYPTPSFSQSAKMNTSDFENYFFNVCNLDYSKMCNAMDALKQLMENTDEVKIVAPNTNLNFSIKNMQAVKCCGECNVPDGEIYTAPIKDSINGQISFNIPSLYNGVEYRDIKLFFKDGKIIDCNCNEKEKFEKILNTDEGSRYIGEFSFGVNPHVTRPILDILFDEKMCGSIHFAIGNSYDDAFNGNKSAIHWDLICNHNPQYGGGEIYFDGKLIRKNGEFIPADLIALNAKNLI